MKVSMRGLGRVTGRFVVHGVLLGLGIGLTGIAAAAQTNGQPQFASQSFQGNPDSALHPGDIVRLRIWLEPDLSGEFPVDYTGVVILPRIGPVTVSGESAASLRQRLTNAYGEFLNHSSIEVSLLRRVQVLGAVRDPGLFQVDPTMNISDVLALAGGATSQGNIDRVDLIRDGRPVATNMSPFTPVGSSPIRSGDQIVVRERSWFARNPGIVIGGVSAILSFTLAIWR